MFSSKLQNIKKSILIHSNFKLLLLFSMLLTFSKAVAQEPVPLQNNISSDSITITRNPELQRTDSIQQPDTVIVDSAAISKAAKKPLLEAEITYSSEDSLIFSIKEQKVYLYDQGVVKYTDIGLTGDYIEFDYNTRIVMAAGALDSAGRLSEKPEFTQGEEKIAFDTMRYNFDTRKAKIKTIVTQQGEGYLHSTQTKRLADGEIHIRRGKYTTCDAPEPHFYIALTKAISIPGKRTVSGPAYLVFEDIPMPLGLPFGFFPNTNKRTSGFIIPEFRDEQRRGFGLENGGWYFAFNDYLDVTLTASIFSRGTWGVTAISQYLKRYKYSGQFSAQYKLERVNDDPSEKDHPGFKINWSHSQDPKANPTRTFRASVDFSTATYEQQHGTSYSNILTNRKNSSISFTKRWPGRPFNFAANLTGDQDTRAKTASVTLPSVTFNMERIYPFRGKTDDGDYNWLENIQISYNSRLINKVDRIPDSLLFTKSVFDRMQNGFSHTVPISLSGIKLLKIINITPGVSYSGVVFPYFIRKYARTDTSLFRPGIEIDTIHKVTYAHAFSASLSVNVSPKLYGMYESKKENSHIIAVRHVLTPKASLSFTPDMKSLVPDYYRNFAHTSTVTQPARFEEYSIYEKQLNPTPTVSGRSGSVSLGLGNNLEMKVRTKDDSTGAGKKVVILDNLDFTTSYRPFAPTNKWAAVNMTGRSTLFNRNLQVQFSSTFDPYALDTLGRTSEKFLISEKSKLFRITRAQVSINFSLQSAAGKKDDKTAGNEGIVESDDRGPENVEDIYDDSDGAIRNDYVDFDIPWTISFDYSWAYNKPGLKANINNSLRVSGDISLTPKWKIGLNTSYDFVAGEFTATNMSVHRDLHCWEMQFGIVPFGTYKSYSFTIRAKSAILRDLKWDKRKTWHDNF